MRDISAPVIMMQSESAEEIKPHGEMYEQREIVATVT